MLYSAEKSYTAVSLGHQILFIERLYHDPETQAHGRREEAIAILNRKISFAWYIAHQYIDAYDAGSQDACCID